MSGAPSSTRVEVYADLGCPFTHVGLRRFVERRAELGRDDVRLVVLAWPLEIVNGRPLDPEFIAEEVDDIRQQVAPGMFAGFDAAAFPATSIPGMGLAARAYEQGAAAGEAVSLELRDLLFEQGVDVAQPDVLAEVAERHGVLPAAGATDRQLVLDDLEEGRERGVIGSPHFFTPAGGFFCPSLDISRDAQGHLRIHSDPEGFVAFIDACLA